MVGTLPYVKFPSPIDFSLCQFEANGGIKKNKLWIIGEGQGIYSEIHFNPFQFNE